MSDELVDILNDDLSFSKTALKSEAHKYGWLHASVHIWFYNKDGQILIQKRSSNKKSFPNLWDVSVAGHISSGESELTSALRETEEEIGLIISENILHKIGIYKEKHPHKKDYIDNEIHHIYIGKLSKDIGQLKIQKEELSEIKLIPYNELKKKLDTTNFSKDYVPHDAVYYEFVLKELLKHL